MRKEVLSGIATALAAANGVFEPNRDLIDSVGGVWLDDDTTISTYDYTNDALARRTSVVNSGVAFGGSGNERLSLWSYNDRNELTASARHEGSDPESPDAPVDAEQFGYVYDPIGNRVTYDEGTPAVPTTYEANQLNQYFRADTDRPSPDNDFGQGYRFDEDGNLIEAFVAADMDCDGQVTGFDIGAFVLALTDPEGYAQQYPDCDPLNGDMDGDGQLTGFDTDLFTQHLAGCTDGCTGMRAEYVWNAENRLIAVVPVAPQAGDKKVEFVYDHIGRRVEKRVYDWDDQAEQWEATPSLHRKFIYSGWLKLLELDGSDNAVRKYAWGLDLAGTGGQSRDREGAHAGHGGPALQGAAGIGGLLAVEQAAIDYPDPDPDIPAGQYLYFYDANGNVGQVVAWASDFGGATGDEWHADRLVAHYEYDPYGNIVNDISGYTCAEENPIRFSTKHFDDETGLGDWGRRYYSSRLGRFIRRDPINEQGAVLPPNVAAGGTFLRRDPLPHRERQMPMLVRPMARYHGDMHTYHFVGNKPTLHVDPIGLEPCCVCGPDITSAVWKLLKNVDKKFGGLNAQQKDDLCDGYIDVGHWDTDLYRKANIFKTEGCPKGKPCGFDNKVPGVKGGAAVTVAGKCYGSYDVNYVLYGRMMKNCGWWNRAKAWFWFDVYKQPIGTQHTMTRYAQAHAWIRFGMGRDWYPSWQPKNLRVCEPCREQWTKPIGWYVVGDNGVKIRG